MKRRDFIKHTALTTAAIISIPSYSLSQTIISEEELIGKGTPKLFGDGYLLRKEVHDAFLKMKIAAEKDNIAIKVVSSYRNYAHQKRIWTRKYKQFTKDGLTPEKAIKKIIEYSTIPGTSRHHWGTDLDIVASNVPQPSALLNPKHFHNNGPFCKLKEWLDTHANTFGFYLVYTDNANRKGFKYEPWHFSYKPLSINYLKAYQKIDVASLLKQDQLIGSKQFTEAFVNQYTKENILDINPELL